MPLRNCFKLAALALLAVCQSSFAANNYPVVLVHGFLGFGDEQFKSSGFKYWGGFDDIPAHMRSHHGAHQVLLSSVSAIASSWDRSAELYYQIKGGCVDYGIAHTRLYEHVDGEHRPPGQCWAADPANNPHNYPLALYPAWDAAHPIHLIAHSQGGQTVRCLIQLLEHGSPHGDEGGGELYKGGKVGWVLSASTIAAPHDGTSLHDAIGNFGLVAADLASHIASTASLRPGLRPAVDLKLDRYGLRRRPGEAERPYLERVRTAPIWNTDNYDTAQYEMGPDGAFHFNAWVKTSPHVYYFSVANVATEQGALCCNNTDRLLAPFQDSRYQYPRWDMAPLTKPYAGEWILPSIGRRGMGSYTQSGAGRVAVDARWFANDGVVNTVSMRSPAGQPVRDYDGRPVRGTWNFLGTYRSYDHFDVLGWPRRGAQAYPIYDAITAILYGL
jgi:triacylglycerol lipase